MKKIGFVGFVFIVAGVVGGFIDVFDFPVGERGLTAFYASILLYNIAGAVVAFFCWQIVSGNRNVMVRMAVGTAVIFGIAWLFSSIVWYQNFINYRVPGQEAPNFFLLSHGAAIREMLYSLALIILLLSVHLRKSLVIDRRNLAAVAVIVVLGIPGTYWHVESWWERVATGEIYILNVYELGTLGFVGSWLFWGSLALAQRRHWQGEPAD